MSDFRWPWLTTTLGGDGADAPDPHNQLMWRLYHIGSQNHQIILALSAIQHQETQIVSDLSAISNAVEANTTVEESAITLLNQLSAQLSAVANDPVAVQALADQITAESATLAAAVAANTPAPPPPPAAPAEPAASPNEPPA